MTRDGVPRYVRTILIAIAVLAGVAVAHRGELAAQTATDQALKERVDAVLERASDTVTATEGVVTLEGSLYCPDCGGMRTPGGTNTVQQSLGAIVRAVPGVTKVVFDLAEQAQGFESVTDEMLLDPDPEDWLMVHRTYDFQAYSPLDQINRENVAQLQLAWMRAMDEGPQEIRPLVHDGVMYIAHPGSDHLQALDATTGDLIWDYERTVPED